MLVVYGLRRKLKHAKSLGHMTCTNCGHNIEAMLTKETGYAHIYYLPVFPWLGGAKFISCPNCGIMKTLTGKEFKEMKNRDE